MNKHYITIALFLLGNLSISSQTNPSAAFEAFKKNPATAALPDYSWAGYKMGAEGIPDIKGKIFDVTKYGALPNDTLEDFEGIQKTIKAAEAAGGGIVFFPRGRFLINEKEGRRDGITISKPNIILRGSGSGAGGTEIFMKQYMLPKDPEKKWTVPAMFTFNYYKGSNAKSVILDNAKRGAMKIVVEDSSGFKAGDFISLRMQNPSANKEFLDNLDTWNIWKTTNEKGVQVSEKHKIAKIEENVITFCEPLCTNITASYNWKLEGLNLAEGLGVEDIWFRGNFHEIIVHHKNFIHDAGWTFLSMGRPANGFIRRIRMSDISTGLSIGNGYACTISNISFDGNPGHSMLNVTNSYGVLVANVHDASNAPGMWHGPCSSNSSCNTVIWRYEGQARSGPDFHASWPYCTLVDASSSKYIGNGGNYELLPNHLKDLTYWNMKQIGKFEKVDFWEPQIYDNSNNEQNKFYGKFVKIVKPNIIGMYGDDITFVKEHLGLYESPGKPVTPESLYEAQLELRLGKLPKWVMDAKK